MFLIKSIDDESFQSFDRDGIIKKNQRELIKHWKKARFKKSNNTQTKFQELESRFFNESTKRDIILDTLYFDNSEEYFSFTVCRNPVERLLSVYQYLGDMFRRKVKRKGKYLNNSR